MMIDRLNSAFKSLLAGGLLALFAFQTPPALANSCDAKAAQVAASNGGRVLSVQSSGGSCRIKILVKSKKGPPVRKTIVVRK